MLIADSPFLFAVMTFLIAVSLNLIVVLPSLFAAPSVYLQFCPIIADSPFLFAASILILISVSAYLTMVQNISTSKKDASISIKYWRLSIYYSMKKFTNKR